MCTGWPCKCCKASLMVEETFSGEKVPKCFFSPADGGYRKDHKVCRSLNWTVASGSVAMPYFNGTTIPLALCYRLTHRQPLASARYEIDVDYHFDATVNPNNSSGNPTATPAVRLGLVFSDEYLVPTVGGIYSGTGIEFSCARTFTGEYYQGLVARTAGNNSLGWRTDPAEDGDYPLGQSGNVKFRIEVVPGSGVKLQTEINGVIQNVATDPFSSGYSAWTDFVPNALFDRSSGIYRFAVYLAGNNNGANVGGFLDRVKASSIAIGNSTFLGADFGHLQHAHMEDFL